MEDYPLEIYLNLEEKFKNIQSEIEKNLKLYFLYNKLNKKYTENNQYDLAQTFLDKKEEALSKLPDGEDKNKAIEICDRVGFSPWID
jgi:hypothetical protein